MQVAVGGKRPPHHELHPAQARDGQQHVVEHRQLRKKARDLERPRHASAVRRWLGQSVTF